MKNLRWSFLGLILYLVALFCLERIGWQNPNLAYTAWLNFWLSLVAVVIVLMTPALVRAPKMWLYLVSAVAFLLFRYGLAWYFPQAPMFGEIYTYITTFQLLLMLLSVTIANQVNFRLSEVNDAIRDITLGNSTFQVQEHEKAVSDIEREFFRSTRHNIPLSLILIEPDSDSLELYLSHSVKEIQKSMIARFVLNRLVSITSQQLRRTDLIVNRPFDHDNFVILSPDTPGENVNVVTKRIIESIKNQTGLDVNYGTATFPEDGLNFENLVVTAQTRLKPDDTHEQPEFARY